MKSTLLMLALIATSGAACASGSSASSDTDPACAQPMTPVAFTGAFSDSALAAGLLVPLLATRDTVEVHILFREGPSVFVDTLALPDSIARVALESKLEAAARSIMPMQFREVLLYRDAAGAERFDVGEGRFCRPVLHNRDELAGALQRAQRQIQSAGHAVLWILVDTTGAPSRVEVNRSSGNEFIDAAAVGVGYVARFTPAMRSGRPVRVWVELPITFVMMGR